MDFHVIFITDHKRFYVHFCLLFFNYLTKKVLKRLLQAPKTNSNHFAILFQTVIIRIGNTKTMEQHLFL